MNPLARVALAVSYAVIILLPCLLITSIVWLPWPAVTGTFLAYAFALLPTYYLDHWFFGGTGYHSPAIFVLLAVIVAVMLWPLPLLSAIPALWHSPRWRRVILGYGIAFIVGADIAAWRMMQSWEMFFG
jgi:hypothetical protein